MKTWPILVAGIITALAFAAYATLLITVSWPIDDWSIEKASLFGDSFGILNSFFTGGAFLLILWTIVLQQAELRLQRQEMSRMVAAYQRELHMDLLNYAFHDHDLAEVWGNKSDDRKKFRQYMYLNLIFSQWCDNFKNDLIDASLSRTRLVVNMKQSEYFRSYWEEVSKGWRGANPNDKKHQEFCDMADEAYREGMAADDDESR